MKQLTWLGIARLGLVQASLGAVVVLTTSVMNRVMVVELALPAILPGVLIAWHYLVQILRPRLGHGSDAGGRRTPWILGGMAVLAAGGVLASLSVAVMAESPVLGVILAVVAFSLVGIGVGASGTSLLVLLARRTDPARRPAAATLVWLMMFAGFVVTSITASHFLDPFSLTRLVEVTIAVATTALVLTGFAVWGMEGPAEPVPAEVAQGSFGAALRQVWAEPHSRRFALFVFFAMLAYSAQELILDPFAGSVFGFTPGQSTQLSGLQHGGALAGMLLVAAASLVGARSGTRFGAMRFWTVGGCVASGLAALVLAGGGLIGQGFPLKAAVVLLGVANGSFAVSAIGAMMQMVSRGARSREGVRMGMWGAAQAVAFGLGGVAATGLSDIARTLLPDSAQAYAVVFAAQAVLFLVAAGLAVQVFSPSERRPGAQTNNGAVLAPSGGA